jgi:biopolymer transport protein ExbD
MTRPQINVTPLIDVLLVLLIIFMIVTPVKPSAFKAKVPQEPRNDGPVTVNPDTLIVIVDANGNIALNREANLGKVGETQKLTDALKDIFARRVENYGLSASGDATVPRQVFIKAPRELNYGSVAKVVDAVKMSGADPIALQIDELN